MATKAVESHSTYFSNNVRIMNYESSWRHSEIIESLSELLAEVIESDSELFDKWNSQPKPESFVELFFFSLSFV